jgi:hypothetical protein
MTSSKPRLTEPRNPLSRFTGRSVESNLASAEFRIRLRRSLCGAPQVGHCWILDVGVDVGGRGMVGFFGAALIASAIWKMAILALLTMPIVVPLAFL